MSRIFFSFALLFALSLVTFAQNTNPDTSTNKSRPRTAEPKAQTPKPSATASQPKPKPAATAAGTVLAAFNKIIDGLRKANVDLVTNGYWNSPTLVLFNYNGSVTKGWAQMRKNREAAYPDIKDVKLDIRDK